jgi:hypothetical protein
MATISGGLLRAMPKNTNTNGSLAVVCISTRQKPRQIVAKKMLSGSRLVPLIEDVRLRMIRSWERGINTKSLAAMYGLTRDQVEDHIRAHRVFKVAA